MAYDDGYYYGQCKIVAVVDNTADNGKTVLITTDDNKTYSGTIANKKCEFLLPPRTLYTVQKVSSGSTEFTTKVEAGYGDCILVHLDTGYVEVKQGDIVGLDYIKAATDANLKNKVPEAKAVKELNNSLNDIKKYNTEKEIAIGTWLVDNKTIYRKCYLFDNVNFSASGFLDNTFTPNKIGKVISIRATAYLSNNGWVDYSNDISINPSGLYMTISGVVLTKLIVVIEYTKP